MYQWLSNDKYKNDVTSDEAWFYLGASQGVRDVYSVRSNQLPQEVKKIEQNDLHPVAVLVWVHMEKFNYILLSVGEQLPADTILNIS